MNMEDDRRTVTCRQMFGLYKDMPEDTKIPITSTNLFKKVRFIFIATALAGIALIICLILLSISSNHKPLIMSRKEYFERQMNNIQQRNQSLKNELNTPESQHYIYTFDHKSRKKNFKEPVKKIENNEVYKWNSTAEDVVNEDKTDKKTGKRKTGRSIDLKHKDVLFANTYPTSQPGIISGTSNTQYASVPLFSERFAQLEASRSNRHMIKNIQDILKYIKIDDDYRSSAEQIKSPTIKFTNVYVTNPSESNNNFDLNITANTPKLKRTQSLNGHAYISDPFMKFKPSHPSVVNTELIPENPIVYSNINNGPRFSTKFARPTIVPQGLPSLIIEEMTKLNGPTTSPGKSTEAIFIQFDNKDILNKELNDQQTLSTSASKKPISVMLDIYPVSSIYNKDPTMQLMPIAGFIPVPGNMAYDNLLSRNSQNQEAIPRLSQVNFINQLKHNRMLLRFNLFPKRISKMK